MSKTIKELGNVLSDDVVTTTFGDVISYVAESVGRTFGPYGHNALIQTMDNVFSTKDGWTVLQNIAFKDPLCNAIKSTIANVAQSTVLLVGDGSTTSTLAANYMNQNISDIKNKYTIRQLEDSLTSCINAVISKLREKAIAIDDSNLYEAIYKIAMVSTNWNDELSKLIADIYVTTKNPIIKIDKSGTDQTYVEYIEGFDLAGSLMSTDFYINNRDNGTCTVYNPYIIIFNHNVQEKHFLSLSCLAEICRTANRALVVIAPGFEVGFTTKHNATNMANLNQRKPVVNLVPIKVSNFYTVDRECIDDFAVLTNCKIVTAIDEDFKGFLDDIATVMTKTCKSDDPDEQAALIEEKRAMVAMTIGYINEVFGTCDELIADEKSVLIKGLGQANEDIVQERKELIQYEIDKKTREYDALTMLSDDIRMKRIRLGKLQCNMGVIKVGGYGAANIKAKTDALDDATRACESAYRDGYTIGGCMAILNAVREIERNMPEDTSEVDKDVYAVIRWSFVSVFDKLFANKYGENKCDWNAITSIIDKCTEENVGYNIITEEFDYAQNVINPVDVDIETLKACMRLVLISVTSDQFIFKHYDISEGDTIINLKEVD